MRDDILSESLKAAVPVPWKCAQATIDLRSPAVAKLLNDVSAPPNPEAVPLLVIVPPDSIVRVPPLGILKLSPESPRVTISAPVAGLSLSTLISLVVTLR